MEIKLDGCVTTLETNSGTKIAIDIGKNLPSIKEYKSLQELVPDNCIHLHTSGHAYFDAIKEVCEVVEPKVIIPIHSEEPKEFEKMNLENSKIEYLKNGEIYEI